MCPWLLWAIACKALGERRPWGYKFPKKEGVIFPHSRCIWGSSWAPSSLFLVAWVCGRGERSGASEVFLPRRWFGGGGEGMKNRLVSLWVNEGWPCCLVTRWKGAFWLCDFIHAKKIGESEYQSLGWSWGMRRVFAARKWNDGTTCLALVWTKNERRNSPIQGESWTSLNPLSIICSVSMLVLSALKYSQRLQAQPLDSSESWDF